MTAINDIEKKDFRIMPLYMDLQAKNIFGTNRNVIFTENLLENYFNLEKGALRGCKITNSVVLTSELIRSKKIEMDIKVELPNGKEINLEFYSFYDKASEVKSFIYITKLFSNQLNIGTKYSMAHEVNQINFIYDDKMRKDSNIIKRYLVMNKDNANDFILKNLFEIDIVNIAKNKDFAYNKINKGLADWIKFMGATSYEEMVKASAGKPILEEALKEMERFSNNQDVSAYFTRDILDATRADMYNEEMIKLEKNKQELSKNIEELSKTNDELSKTNDELSKNNDELSKNNKILVKENELLLKELTELKKSLNNKD